MQYTRAQLAAHYGITRSKLRRILKALQIEPAQKKKCCICKRYFPVQQMIANRCAQCYVEKCCKPIVYGKQVWNKVVNTKLVSAAIRYLSSVQ